MHKAVVFWGLCAVLVFVPLPLGSVDEWAIFVFEAAVLALFLVYLGGELLARKKTRGARGETGEAGKTRFSGPPETGFRARGEEWDGYGAGGGSRAVALPRAVKVLLAVFFAASIIQILPLPPGMVKVLSPRTAALYQGMARDGLAGWDARSWWTLSLSPLLSAGELVLLLCYGLFGFLTLRTVRTRRRIEIFVLVIIASALFQAFYGMAETFSGSEKIFGYQKKYNIGSVTGTYVNRNHFAGFMEMAFPLSLGYLLAKGKYFLMEKGLSWRRKILWFGQEGLQWSLLFGLGTVFIGVALVFSKSRSGVMIFLVTVILAAAAFGNWRELSDRADERRRRRGILRLVAAVVLAAVLWLGIGPIIERFGEMDISKEARRTFMANTFEMAREFPWAGTGKGSFVYAYAMYKKVDTGTMLSYAHNDYLEIAAENGFVAGLCLIAAGIWLVVFLAGRWRKRRNNFAKGIGLGAILGILALFIHGFTDFNFQIPANAVYFVGLCALALNLVVKRGQEEEGGGGREKAGEDGRMSVAGETAKREGIGKGPAGGGGAARAPGLELWKAMMGGGLAIALLAFAAGEFLGFHYLGLYQDARAEARSVQSAFPELEGLMKKATGYSGNPELRKELARLYVEMARAQNESGQTEKRDASCDLAVANYTAVLERNPIDSFAHYEMGMTYLLYNYPMTTYADKAKLYFRKALELNPSDQFLNLNILFFYLTSWDGLAGEDKEYVGGRLRRIRAADPAFMPQLEERWKQQFGSTARLDRILIGVGPT
ncbi:MAG: O-antigen ligase family protein [Candidatus Aminicenantales bacterium]